MYYIVLILMTFIGSIAALNLKRASSAAGLIGLLYDKYFYFGGVLYFISALLNIVVLRYLDYSVVLPLTSITYIWTMILSAKKLNEHITIKKILGILAISGGALLVAL